MTPKKKVVEPAPDVPPKVPNADCALWEGAISSEGYGTIGGGSDKQYAHRAIYELVFEAIPVGYDIHHTCKTRACVNPAHLVAIPHGAHISMEQTKTHCKHGHEFTPENTYRRKDDGTKQCRICNRERGRATWHRNKSRYNQMRRKTP